MQRRTKGLKTPGLKATVPVTIPPKPNNLTATPTLKVTLVWTDQSGTNIQNFLKLSVQGVGIAGSPTKFGNEHHVVENNVQQVVWGGFTGTGVTIVIEAIRIRDANGSQPFALV